MVSVQGDRGKGLAANDDGQKRFQKKTPRDLGPEDMNKVQRDTGENFNNFEFMVEGRSSHHDLEHRQLRKPRLLGT